MKRQLQLVACVIVLGVLAAFIQVGKIGLQRGVSVNSQRRSGVVDDHNAIHGLAPLLEHVDGLEALLLSSDFIYQDEEQARQGHETFTEWIFKIPDDGPVLEGEELNGIAESAMDLVNNRLERTGETITGAKEVTTIDHKEGRSSFSVYDIRGGTDRLMFVECIRH